MCRVPGDERFRSKGSPKVYSDGLRPAAGSTVTKRDSAGSKRASGKSSVSPGSTPRELERVGIGIGASDL